MPLYKYVTADRIDILKSGMIRFTSPAELNDPFEFKPHVNAVASEKDMKTALLEAIPQAIDDALLSFPEGLRDLIRKENLFSAMHASVDNGVNQISRVISDILPVIRERIEREFEENIGILSLTEDRENLLMWSHYADSHKGFIIEFDENSSFFNGRRSEKDEMWHLKDVLYKDERPSISLSGMDNFSPYITKGLLWSYEKEWRMMAPLRYADIIRGDRKEIHLFVFPRESITGIIFGARMTEEKKKEVFSLININSAYAHVRVMQSVADHIHYKVNISEVSI